MKIVTRHSKHAGSNLEVFWFWPVMAIVQSESGQIIYARSNFPHLIWFCFSKEGLAYCITKNNFVVRMKFCFQPSLPSRNGIGKYSNARMGPEPYSQSGPSRSEHVSYGSSTVRLSCTQPTSSSKTRNGLDKAGATGLTVIRLRHLASRGATAAARLTGGD